VVFAIVTFFARCAFQLNEEHFLIALIISLTLLVMSLIFTAFNEILLERKTEILKQLIKQQVFERLLLDELQNQLKTLANVIEQLAEISYFLIEYVPEACEELYNLNLELECQTYIAVQLEQIKNDYSIFLAFACNDVIETLNNEVFEGL